MAAFQKFDQFVADLAAGVHQLQTGTAHVLKVALSNTAPAAANAVLADIVQLANGNGYTTGGVSVGTITGAQASGVFKLTGATDPVWTGITAPMGPFRYAVLFNDTPTSPVDPLVGFWDYGSAVTLQIGETFTVDLDQTNGILTIQ
jgi:hypothetical protein